jgi:M6 family metalloprotease-like protein
VVRCAAAFGVLILIAPQSVLATNETDHRRETPRTYGGGPTLVISRPVGYATTGEAARRLLAPGAQVLAQRFGPGRRPYPDDLHSSHSPRRVLDRSRSLLPAARARRGVNTRAQEGYDFPIIALRVDFRGDSLGSETSTPDGKFDLRPYVDSLGDTVNVPIDPPPHNRAYFEAHMEALRRYYELESHGHAHIRGVVFPAASDSAYHLYDTSDYGPWLLFSGYNPFDTASQFVHDAVRAAAEDPTIPWGDYAMPDGNVRVMIFHAGPDLQSDINGDSPRDIPSFFIPLEDSVPVAGGQYYVKYATVVPETASEDEAYGALNGVLAHETGHQMGLPDLYDTYFGLPVLGLWSLMDSGNLTAGPTLDSQTGEVIYVSGLIPASLDAWSKAYLWPDFVQGGFAPELRDSLRAIELAPQIVQVPINATEYFLLENRQTDVNGDDSIFVQTDSLTHVVLGPKAGRATDAPPLPEYDALLPGSGVLIWHVDEEQLFRSVNDDPSRLGVSLEEADGTRDLGDFNALPYTYGGPQDPFYVGNKDSIGPATHPSTRANEGGDSHVTIRVLSPVALTMAVEATEAWTLPGFPVVFDDTMGTGSPLVVDRYGDGRNWILVPTGSSIQAVSSDGGTTEGLPFGQSDDGSPFRDEIAFGRAALPRNETAEDTNVVVATTQSGALYVWDAFGRRVNPWVAPLPAFTSAPSFMGTSILVGAQNGRVYRLGLDGGVETIGPSLGAPVVSTPRSVLVPPGAGGGVLPETLVVAAASSGTVLSAFRPAGTSSPPAGDYVAQVGAGPDWRPQISLARLTPPGATYTPEIVIADASGRVYALDVQAQLLPGWPVNLGDSSHAAPAVADLDGDGFPEVILPSRTGVVGAWNANGSPVRLWPSQADVPEGDGGETVASPLVGDLDQSGRQSVLLALGSGNLVPRTGDGRTLAGWPLSLNYEVASTPTLADVNGDGTVDVVVLGRALLLLEDGFYLVSVLYVFSPGTISCTGQDCEGKLWWPMLGVDPARTGARVTWPGGMPAEGAPVVTRMYVSPNPLSLASGRAVHIGYTLPAGATRVEAEVFDITGRRVARLTGTADASDNAIVWQTNGAGPGPYLCRLRVVTAAKTEEHIERLMVRP